MSLTTRTMKNSLWIAAAVCSLALLAVLPGRAAGVTVTASAGCAGGTVGYTVNCTGLDRQGPYRVEFTWASLNLINVGACTTNSYSTPWTTPRSCEGPLTACRALWYVAFYDPCGEI